MADNQVLIETDTGGDDARGDSSVTANLLDSQGRELTTGGVVLKQSNGSWPNGSHNKSGPFTMNPSDVQLIHGIKITLVQGGHFPEGDDNWNLDGLKITTLPSQTVILQIAGGPLNRFTGDSPSWTHIF